MLFALTDIQDIGRYMSQIITDSRTLNQIVFAYNEIWTQNQIYDLIEKLSGERLDCKYVRNQLSLAELRSNWLIIGPC
jgi:NADH:ubiquinone oxidoreductase subunit D